MKQERDTRFIMIRFDVLERKDLTAKEKIVYGRMCGFEKYFESKEECAQILGMSAYTVAKAKTKLLELGYIEEIGNTGRGKIYQVVLNNQPNDSGINEQTSNSGVSDTPKVAHQTSNSGVSDTPKVADIVLKENKTKINNITNVISQEAIKGEKELIEYGNSDINELFTYWSKTIGTTISSQVKQNRQQCKNLIKKKVQLSHMDEPRPLGVDGVKYMVNALALSRRPELSNTYPPRVSDYVEMTRKLNKLIEWIETKLKKEVSNVSSNRF